MEINEFKNCPFCDEEIKFKAIKCRYCQSYLNEESVAEIEKNEDEDHMTDSKENDNEELNNGDKDKLDDIDFESAGTSIDIDSHLRKKYTIYDDAFKGSYKITLIGKKEFKSPLRDSFLEEDISSRGKFVCIQCEIQNNTDDTINLLTHLYNLIAATDGVRKWYPHLEATTQISLTNKEAFSEPDELGAGFTDTAWVAFDVPEDAEVRGLFIVSHVSYRSKDPIPLRLP